MPLTPKFHIQQDEKYIIFVIKVPYIKVSNIEIIIDKNCFNFYCKPYILKCVLNNELNEDEELCIANYDMNDDHGTITVKILKKIEGQYFHGLDLISQLLQNPNNPKKQRVSGQHTQHNRHSGIEEIDTRDVDASAGGIVDIPLEDMKLDSNFTEGQNQVNTDNKNWNEAINDSINALPGLNTTDAVKYGFNQQYCNILNDVYMAQQSGEYSNVLFECPFSPDYIGADAAVDVGGECGLKESSDLKFRLGSDMTVVDRSKSAATTTLIENMLNNSDSTNINTSLEPSNNSPGHTLSKTKEAAMNRRLCRLTTEQMLFDSDHVICDFHIYDRYLQRAKQRKDLLNLNSGGAGRGHDADVDLEHDEIIFGWLMQGIKNNDETSIPFWCTLYNSWKGDGIWKQKLTYSELVQQIEQQEDSWFSNHYSAHAGVAVECASFHAASLFSESEKITMSQLKCNSYTNFFPNNANTSERILRVVELFCGLADLLYAYCYEVRFVNAMSAGSANMGKQGGGASSDWPDLSGKEPEFSVESARNVSKLSNCLSWLEDFHENRPLDMSLEDMINSRIKEVIIFNSRRSMIFAYFRVWRYHAVILADVTKLLMMASKRILIKCLLQLYALFEKNSTHESYYYYNTLYILDYISWLQSEFDVDIRNHLEDEKHSGGNEWFPLIQSVYSTNSNSTTRASSACEVVTPRMILKIFGTRYNTIKSDIVKYGLAVNAPSPNTNWFIDLPILACQEYYQESLNQEHWKQKTYQGGCSDAKDNRSCPTQTQPTEAGPDAASVAANHPSSSDSDCDSDSDSSSDTDSGSCSDSDSDYSSCSSADGSGDSYEQETRLPMPVAEQLDYGRYIPELRLLYKTNQSNRLEPNEDLSGEPVFDDLEGDKGNPDGSSSDMSLLQLELAHQSIESFITGNRTQANTTAVGATNTKTAKIVEI